MYPVRTFATIIVCWTSTDETIDPAKAISGAEEIDYEGHDSLIAPAVAFPAQFSSARS
jgi:hypothetical protein